MKQSLGSRVFECIVGFFSHLQLIFLQKYKRSKTNFDLYGFDLHFEDNRIIALYLFLIFF